MMKISILIVDQNHKIILMDSLDFLESPHMRKIRDSSFQVKSLIQSLRNNPTHKKVCFDKTPSGSHSQGTNKEGPNIQFQQKDSSRPNNFPAAKQSENRLRVKPKMEVGDRNQIKQIHQDFDINPEVELIFSKQIFNKNHEVSSKFQGNPFHELGQSRKKNTSIRFQKNQPTESNRSHFSEVKDGSITQYLVKYKQTKDEIFHLTNGIRSISEERVKDYLEKKGIISEESESSDIFNFFVNLCLFCDILVQSPIMEQNKNCVYFGSPISQSSLYQGFLYFYDGKIYYGEFLNRLKHGQGVQININEPSTLKGEFKEGHKTGKVCLYKPKEKYIGFMENGIYQGEGQLTTQHFLYEGLFDKGEKNGYGEQLYHKTGVKVTGVFKNGVLQKTKPSKLIPQIRIKTKVTTPSKEKKKTDQIRKNSIDRHSQSINKTRSHINSECENELGFSTVKQHHESSKIQQNFLRLQMYNKYHHKLSKICQEFDYSIKKSRKIDSFNSNHDTHRRKLSHSRVQSSKERMSTAQRQDPLARPFLTVYQHPI